MQRKKNNRSSQHQSPLKTHYNNSIILHYLQVAYHRIWDIRDDNHKSGLYKIPGFNSMHICSRVENLRQMSMYIIYIPQNN